ncbi:MAG TPA: hypothetical protein VG457_16270 [Planctomycetota bacterium]|jgi:hypothetical protein|nr:hypothetical protein [Planctomycetota bacterium]
MRTLALLLVALLGGCWYDRPNPWRTEGDVEALRYKTEHDWMLELRATWNPPQADGAQLTLPDLEGWRDSVLLNADAAVLTHMRDQSVQKIASLESRAYALAPLNADSKVQIYELMWQSRVEKIRLQFIENRLASAAR